MNSLIPAWLSEYENKFVTVSEACDISEPVSDISMPETITWADTEYTDSGNYPNFPGNGQMPDFGNGQFPQQPDGSNGYFPNFPNNNDDNGSDAGDNSDGRKNNPV